MLLWPAIVHTLHLLFCFPFALDVLLRCCICCSGFGFVCVAATPSFPLHIGAALANLLFTGFCAGCRRLPFRHMHQFFAASVCDDSPCICCSAALHMLLWCNHMFAAGFGFPCVAATAFFPMHIGAALANLLFPAFILVAAGADPLAAQREWLGCTMIGCITARL